MKVSIINSRTFPGSVATLYIWTTEVHQADITHTEMLQRCNTLDINALVNSGQIHQNESYQHNTSLKSQTKYSVTISYNTRVSIKSITQFIN